MSGEDDPRLGKDFHFGSTKWPGTAKLLEEMGELTQVLGKLLALGGETQGWNGEDLFQKLMDESADLHAALLFFFQHNFSSLSGHEVRLRTESKLRQFEAWHESAPKKVQP